MKRLFMAILLAGAVASLAMAQCPGHQGQGQMSGKNDARGMMDRGGHRGAGMGLGQWWENPMVVKELGLSDKQAEQIDDLTLKHRKSVVRLEADLKIAEMDFQDLMEGDPSESEIRKKAKDMSQLRERMQDLRIDHMLAVRRVLTPEQQKKLKELKPSRRQHRMMMDRGGCQGMPCPPAPPEAPAAPAEPR